MVLRKMIENLLHFLIKLSFESSLSSSVGACEFTPMILHQRPLRAIYDILSLTKNYSLHSWYYSVVHKTSCSQLMTFHTFSIETTQSSAFTVPHVSHLTFCTPTKSNLFPSNSLATVVSEPYMYRPLTFLVPNLMSLFHCLGRTKGWVRARDTVSVS